ncbi:MAG: ATP-binding cassette domain-containing protein [Gaiellaceae bacterium]
MTALAVFGRSSRRSGRLSKGSHGAEIRLEQVSKRYPGSEADAVSNLSLTVRAGELCVLVGPSGCGKTTTLRMINRLTALDSGEIKIDGRSTRSATVTELRRGIGYVIQEGGLFPHMTVAGNIGTVPRLLGWPRNEVKRRVSELLELAGLDLSLAERYPVELSGGQRQRVGLARALAADPPLLLMDEPFNALDPVVRERLQDELLRLHRELAKTIVFVTHDVDEAIKMGNRIAILRQGGVLAQYDTPDSILARPANEFVRQFVGENRALRRLALRRLDEIELAPSAKAAGKLPIVSAAATVREAVSLMIESGAKALTVVDENGKARGSIHFDDAARLLR